MTDTRPKLTLQLTPEERARRMAAFGAPIPAVMPRPAGKTHVVSVRARSLKVTVVLDPQDLTPATNGAQVELSIRIDGGLKAKAKLNPKTYKRAVAKIAELGAENAVVLAQGRMLEPGVIEDCGVAVQPKAPKAERNGA